MQGAIEKHDMSTQISNTIASKLISSPTSHTKNPEYAKGSFDSSFQESFNTSLKNNLHIKKASNNGFTESWAS